MCCKAEEDEVNLFERAERNQNMDHPHLDEPRHVSGHIVDVVRLGLVRLRDLGRADSAVVKDQNCMSVLQELATAAPSHAHCNAPGLVFASSPASGIQSTGPTALSLERARVSSAPDKRKCPLSPRTHP